MNRHPNATVASGTGLVAVLVAWILGFLGIDLSAEDGAAIAAVLASVALLLGRQGVVPTVRRILYGKQSPEPPLEHPARRHHR